MREYSLQRTVERQPKAGADDDAETPADRSKAPTPTPPQSS